MNVITNHKPRPIIGWSDLTPKEQKEFDYFDSKYGEGMFVRYRGRIYDLNDMPWQVVGKDIHCTLADSFFSAVRFILDKDAETVIAATLHS